MFFLNNYYIQDKYNVDLFFNFFNYHLDDFFNLIKKLRIKKPFPI